MSDTANNTTNWILAVCAIVGAVLAIGGAVVSWWRSSKSNKAAQTAEAQKNATVDIAANIKRIADKAEEESTLEVELTSNKDKRTGDMRISANAVLHGDRPLTVESFNLRGSSGQTHRLPEQLVPNNHQASFERNGDSRSWVLHLKQLQKFLSEKEGLSKGPITIQVLVKTTTGPEPEFTSNALVFTWDEQFREWTTSPP